MTEVPMPVDLEGALAQVDWLREEGRRDASQLGRLAIGLYYLGCKFGERYAPAGALGAFQEALEVAADLSPRLFRPEHLRVECWWRSGLALTRLERRAEAVREVRRAVDLARHLAARASTRFEWCLRKALCALGTCLARYGRPAEALAAAEDAVFVQRLWAEGKPGPHTRDFAAGLAVRGWRRAEVGRFADARRDFEEALEIHRKDPCPELEQALWCCSGLVEALLRLGEVPEALEEARAANRVARKPLTTRLPVRPEFQIQAALDHSRAAARAGLVGEAVMVGEWIKVLARELERTGPRESLIPLVLASENQAELALALGDREAAWLAYRDALVRLEPEHARLPRAHGPLMARLARAATGVRVKLGLGPDPRLAEQLPGPGTARGAGPPAGSVPGPAVPL